MDLITAGNLITITYHLVVVGRLKMSEISFGGRLEMSEIVRTELVLPVVAVVVVVVVVVARVSARTEIDKQGSKQRLYSCRVLEAQVY